MAITIFARDLGHLAVSGVGSDSKCPSRLSCSDISVASSKGFNESPCSIVRRTRTSRLDSKNARLYCWSLMIYIYISWNCIRFFLSLKTCFSHFSFSLEKIRNWILSNYAKLFFCIREENFFCFWRYNNWWLMTRHEDDTDLREIRIWKWKKKDILSWYIA